MEERQKRNGKNKEVKYSQLKRLNIRLFSQLPQEITIWEFRRKLQLITVRAVSFWISWFFFHWVFCKNSAGENDVPENENSPNKLSHINSNKKKNPWMLHRTRINVRMRGLDNIQTSTEKNKLEAVEMWFLRRRMKISWMARKSNDTVLKEAHTSRALVNKIRTRQTTFYGHVMKGKS